MLSTILSKVSDVCFDISFPLAALEIVSSIRARLCTAASALCAASAPTSPATTANPFPASPALAASIDAFSASRFVWSAISSIVWITVDIFLDASVISVMDDRSSSIFSLLSATSCLISAEISCEWDRREVFSLNKLPVFSTATLKSEIVCACAVQLSANAPLASAISVAPSATSFAICVISLNIRSFVCTILYRLFARLSCEDLILTKAVISPSATLCTTWTFSWILAAIFLNASTISLVSTRSDCSSSNSS